MYFLYFSNRSKNSISSTNHDRGFSHPLVLGAICSRNSRMGQAGLWLAGRQWRHQFHKTALQSASDQYTEEMRSVTLSFVCLAVLAGAFAYPSKYCIPIYLMSNIILRKLCSFTRQFLYYLCLSFYNTFFIVS